MNRTVKKNEETLGSSFTSQTTTAERSKVIYMTYFILTLDIACMFLHITITPYLARKLGLDTLQFGYLQTVAGFLKLFGGPIFGRIADLFGARAALSLACSSTIAFFLLMAIADHPVLLFIHKLPLTFMHVLPGSQMVITDLSEPEKRADALSKLGLCYGIGIIAGSTLGGNFNTHYGETLTACVGAAGGAVSLLLVLMFIPKTTKAQASASNKDHEHRKKSIFSVREITRLKEFPGVARIFVVKIISGLPSGIFQAMFSVIAMDIFNLLPQQNGYMMAYFGIVQMFIQAGMIGWLTAKYSEKSLLLLSVGVSSLVGLAQAFMTSTFQFCVIAVPMMFSLIMFNVITDSMLTKSVPPTDTGTLLGLCSSVQSLLRTVGPTAGGVLYMYYGIASIGLFQFVVNVVVFVYLLRLRLNKTSKDE